MVACGSEHDDPEGLPETLAETGIDDPAVQEIEPAYPLWSDGAEKRRWLLLPDGAAIDKSDPDNWRFPIGTRAWKQFSRDGVLIETRLLEKTGDSEWAGVAYVWNGDQTEAIATPDGMENAGGTDHDVPDREQCGTCHDGAADMLLGISAVQLGEYAIPGDPATRDALGYLHANCGNCHNERNADNPLRLWLTVDLLDDPETTPTYLTTVGQPTQADPVPGLDADVIVVAGDASASMLYQRMTTRGKGAMPFLGTETVDTEGAAAVAAWIDSLK